MAAQLPQTNSFGIDAREDLAINAIEIFDTIKQSLVVLNKDLNVAIANASMRFSRGTAPQPREQEKNQVGRVD